VQFELPIADDSAEHHDQAAAEAAANWQRAIELNCPRLARIFGELAVHHEELAAAARAVNGDAQLLHLYPGLLQIITIGEYTGLRRCGHFMNICRVTGKFRHASRPAGEAAIRSLKKRGLDLPEKGELRAYACRHCDGFHTGHVEPDR
jgi:hypothetical protein